MFDAPWRRSLAPDAPIRSPDRRGRPTLRERPEQVEFAPAVPVALRLDPDPKQRGWYGSWRRKIELPALSAGVGRRRHPRTQEVAGLACRGSGSAVDEPVRRSRAAGSDIADERAWLAHGRARTGGSVPRNASARFWRSWPSVELPGERVDHRTELWPAPDHDRERRGFGPYGDAAPAGVCRLAAVRDQ
jgi:hypothetical protein